MATLVETMWHRISRILSGFAERVTAVDRTLRSDVGRIDNSAFPLRAYVAFRRTTVGDEVAITIDVRSDDEVLMIQTDAALDDGRSLAIGPSATIALGVSGPEVQVAIDCWLRDFEQFLVDSEPAILAANALLT